CPVMPQLSCLGCASRTFASPFGVDLAGVRELSEISRSGLDAGTLSKLRSPYGRLRRLPLSGLHDHWQCQRNRSCMFLGSLAQLNRETSSLVKFECADPTTPPQSPE